MRERLTAGLLFGGQRLAARLTPDFIARRDDGLLREPYPGPGEAAVDARF